MPLFIFFIFFIAALYFASRSTQSTPPDRGNPKLPTVSQARRVPLAVGKTKVDGPNVLEATPYQATVNKIKSKGLFGGSSQEVGFSYYQNIEMAIAYGPGELYDIYWGDIFGISPNFTSGNIESTVILQEELFGDRHSGAGGVSGVIEFIPGDNAGHISRMESLTGRDQPGMPNLARVIFHSTEFRGFYWGNSEVYKPTAFIYGFYPNPFSEATKHKIGNGANPAYVLYEIANNSLYGMGLLGNVSQPAIQTLADLMVTEGLGIQRTWYESDGGAIERELLDYMDAVRFRDPDSGDIIYKAIRDDFDVMSIPSINDDNIIELEINGPGLATSATKVTVEFLDENRFFEAVKIEVPNVANRIIVNRDTAVDKTFHGAGNSTLATKLGTREARKATKGRKQGKLICDRAAWDWALGDTFLLTRELEGIANLPVRIVEHSKGTLQDGRVTIKWIEELFSFGVASYGIPVISVDQQITNPADVTEYYNMLLPVFLINEEDINRYVIFAVAPTVSSLGFYLEESTGPGFTRTTFNGYAWDQATIFTPADPLDSTLVLSGALNFSDIELSNTTTSLQNAFNLLIIEVSSTGEHEIVLFTGWTYDTALNQTTLTGVERGLLDTYPQRLTAGDKVWRYDDGEVNAISVGSAGTAYFRMFDTTNAGELTSPTNRSFVLNNRFYKPHNPKNIRIEGQYFPEAASAQIDVLWTISSRDWVIENGIDNWTDAVNRTIPTNTTFIVRYYNDDTGSLLQTNSGLTGTSDSYTPLISAANIRVEVEANDSVNGLSLMPFQHVFAWAPVAPPALNLIHHYTGDNISGSTINDEIGGGVNGTMTNVTINSSGGQIGDSLIFNGTNSEIQFTGSLYALFDFSISFWMKHPNSPGVGDAETILQVGNNGELATDNANLLRIIETSGSWQFQYYTETGAGVDNTLNLGVNAVVDSNWHHYVLVVRDGLLTFYIDNTRVVSNTPVTNTTGSTADTYVGRQNASNPNEEWLDAELDQIKIYDGILADADVNTLFNET